LTNPTSSAPPRVDAEPLRSKLSAYREKSSQLRPDFARAYDDLEQIPVDFTHSQRA
jgi:hypothetical protein